MRNTTNTVLAQVSIPTSGEAFPLSLVAGHSIIFVGANGAGKTRLGVKIEKSLADNSVRRIAAHRSLTMSDKLNAVSLERALLGLATGHPDPGGNRHVHRWNQQPEVSLLSDYDWVLQALFAEQSRVSIAHLQNHLANPDASPPITKLSRLKTIWERLLPHRVLKLQELGVKVIPASGEEDKGYSGSQMSDGERVIFYLIGQSLLAPENSVLIFDEPELHIHKAILSRLWDIIESERSDCCFIYITHDLDFVIARPLATKLVIRSYSAPDQWDIEPLPAATDLPDRLVSELVGTRQPVLFVEGERESMDAIIYRCVYSNFLVQPIGSCEAVIHAVASFEKNSTLHRIGQVKGCIDADGRESEVISHLASRSIYVLPVSEIENIFIMPSVFYQLARCLHFTDEEINNIFEELTNDIISKVQSDMESASVRYATRQLDRTLKTLAPAARTIDDLAARFATAIASIDIASVAVEYKNKLIGLIQSRDISGILAIYDSKSLLTFAAQRLGLKNRGELAQFAGRFMAKSDANPLIDAIKGELPHL